MNDMDKSASKWISVLYRHRKKFMSKRLEQYGSVGGFFALMLTVSLHDGSSQEQISDYLKIDKTTTAKAIKKLEDEGYIRRETDSSDKRVNRVYLTQKSFDIIPEIKATLLEWDDLIDAGITEEAYQQTVETLHKMAENACRGISGL